MNGPGTEAPYDVQCPDCAQLTGEYCVNWVDLRGNVEDKEHVHGGRLLESARRHGASLPLAPEPIVHRAIAAAVLNKLFGGV